MSIFSCLNILIIFQVIFIRFYNCGISNLWRKHGILVFPIDFISVLGFVHLKWFVEFPPPLFYSSHHISLQVSTMFMRGLSLSRAETTIFICGAVAGNLWQSG